MKRKICIITGTRAEYGLLFPLLKEISNDSSLKLQIIVTGMHLSTEFGLTYKEIENDGFKIDNKIKILSSSDTPVAILKSMGLAQNGFAEAYQELKPDIIVVLGDRFEIFSSVTAAMISLIPVGHLHGGETTEGAFDESIRHSITKMSHLHFTATEEYKKRVIQLGEDPKRVFNVGAIGLDNIKNLKLLSKKELEKDLNVKFNEYNLLVTFHPVTLEDNTSQVQFHALLNAIDKLNDHFIVFTKANADTHGRVINNMIDKYVNKNPHRSKFFTSLGQLKYLSMMRYVNAVVGNSSSGIIEAPSFKIGTINIGDRQKGRIRAESVIDCKPEGNSIKRALNRLYSKDFQNRLKSIKNPYEGGNSAKKIKEILKNYDLNNILKKEFYNLHTKY